MWFAIFFWSFKRRWTSGDDHYREINKVCIFFCSGAGTMAPVDTNTSSDMDDIIAAQQQVVKDILPAGVGHGVLIPLKTTLELRDDHRCVNVVITRVPVKSANAVIT